MPRNTRSATLERRGRATHEAEVPLPAETSQASVASPLPVLIASSGINNDMGTDNREIEINQSENHSIAGSSGGCEASAFCHKGSSQGYKLATSIIPEYDGKNMPVSMFIEHCRAAAEAVESHEIKYLILFIRTRVTKDARKYVWGKSFDTLDALLRQLERSARTTDSTQLMLKLSSNTRQPGESIADYGSRTLDLVSEICTCLEQEYPGAVGKSMALGTKHGAIKHFMRGLDEPTLARLGKEPQDLDEAIDLARKADVEANCWRVLHEKTNNKPVAQFVQKACVAHLQSSVESPGNSRGKSLSNIQCYCCKELGHIKRDCPQLHQAKGGMEWAGNTHCDYCERNNHCQDDCFLKRKHDNERAAVIAKKSRTSNKGNNLNSNRDRRSDAPTAQVFTVSLNNDASSTSETTTEFKSQ